MPDFLSPTNIMFTIGLLGVIFTVYNYFKNPQIRTEKKESLLAQQVQWEKELTEKRFEEMGARISESMTLAQNHIHTIDVKMDKLTEQVNSMNLSITRMSTIIQERIPCKVV